MLGNVSVKSWTKRVMNNSGLLILQLLIVFKRQTAHLHAIHCEILIS